jgi:hypothetical protein
LRDCDFAICRVDDAARFFEKRSVPTVSDSGATQGVQLKIVLTFYGRKMQPIHSRAIILNTLLLRLTLRKMKPTPATPIPP